MEINLKQNAPIIVPRVKFSGPKASREVDLVFDTGAIYTSISWDVAKDIGYDPAAVSKRTKIVTANGVIEVPLLKVSEMAVADLNLRNVHVICHDIPALVEVDGLLGLSFLQHFTTTIDYKNQICSIT